MGLQDLQGTLDLSVLLALVERQGPQDLRVLRVLREQMAIIMFLQQLLRALLRATAGLIATTAKPMCTMTDIG